MNMLLAGTQLQKLGYLSFSGNLTQWPLLEMVMKKGCSSVSLWTCSTSLLKPEKSQGSNGWSLLELFQLRLGATAHVLQIRTSFQLLTYVIQRHFNFSMEHVQRNTLFHFPLFKVNDIKSISFQDVSYITLDFTSFYWNKCCVCLSNKTTQYNSSC